MNREDNDMSIDTKALRALCPLEWQGKGRHDIYGTEGCEFAQFGNLEHSVGPAGFEVYTDLEDWFSTFWHGNRGHQLGRFASQGDAKKAAQAHADKLVASFAPTLLDAADRLAALEAENARLQAELARVRELPAKWRAAPQNPDEPLLAMAADELDAALYKPAEQHDPLAVSDHCPECSEPEPECVCGEQPDERESLPLMARRLRHKDDDLGELYENGKRLCTISGEPPLREPMPGFVLYRIADTDEHGLPVIERTADMPKRAKYRISWITQAGEVEYTDSLPLALEANRSGAVSERIEDYRPAAQESGDA